ncbi:MAG: ATP-binding protein [Halopseudomonas sp.]
MFLSKKSDTQLLLLCSLLSLIIFVIDLSIPLGVAGGVPYVLVILLALQASNNRYASIFAWADTLLTLAGLYFSDTGGIYWMVLANRALAIFAIWVTALLGLKLKQLQASLLESEGRFQFMADQAPLMIWGTDPAGRWNFFSKGWLDYTGQSRIQQLGDGWQARLRPSEREQVIQAFQHALNQRQSFQVECRLLRSGGDYRWMILQGVPRFLESGVFAGFIGTGLDINDLKDAELKLDETMQKYFHREKMASIGTLAAGLLHEINNPVASISSLVQELINDNTPSQIPLDEQAEKHHSYLTTVHNELNRLTRITRDVSRFAPMMNAEFEPQNLNDLIKQTCRLMQHDERMQNVSLEFQLSHSIPAVELVADHFIQLLLNLLSNAVDACDTPPGNALILIHTWFDHGRVKMEVRDNGQGMSADTLAKAREPFFSTKPADKGMGLGLALSNTLIDESKGEMKIVSELGKGTSIFVSFRPFEVAA